MTQLGGEFMMTSGATFRGITTVAGLAGLLYNVRVPGRAIPNTIAVLVHDTEDAPTIAGWETAKSDADLATLRALCVGRKRSSPFLSLARLRQTLSVSS